MPTTPNQNTTALQNYAGTFSKELIGRTLNGLDIVGHCKVLYNLTAPLNLTKLLVNGGIRPLDTAVNKADKPGRVWSKRTLTPRTGMKIFQVIPAELMGTWQSEMLDPNAKDVPFAQWVWEQEFSKLAQELNDNIAYAEFHGDAADFDAATVYQVGDVFVYGANRDIYKTVTLTTAGQTPDSNAAKFTKINQLAICDGPLTIIKNELAATNITAVATNAFSSTNAVAELRKIWKAAPVAIRNKSTKMFISYDVWEFYKDDYDTRYGKGNSIASYIEDQKKIFLKGTSGTCELIPCTWMGSSSRVFMTLPENFLMGTNVLSDISGIGKVVENLHGFDAICKFIISFQFADLEVLYVNDKL